MAGGWRVKVTKLDQLLARISIDADITLAIWNDGADLHFGWFGMDNDEAIARLQNVIANIQANNATNLGPSPTKH